MSLNEIVNGNFTCQNLTVLNSTIYTSSGCFINSIRNVAEGTGPTLVKYNSITKELSYVNNKYVYAYDTTTQSASGANLYNAIKFNTNEILEGWTHSTGTSDFVVDLNNQAYFCINYNLQIVANSNSDRSMGVYIDVDGSPVKGSFRTVQVTNIGNEIILTNSSIISLQPGSHTVKLLMSQSDPTNGLTIQPSALLVGPDGSISSATIDITRVA